MVTRSVRLGQQLYPGDRFLFGPKLSGSAKRVFALAWLCMWTVGVTLHWFANIYAWHWRALLPVSGTLELAAGAGNRESGFRTGLSRPL